MEIPILVVPAKENETRAAVAAAWAARGWEVLRLDRFWEPPLVAPGRVRLYGNTTFCLVLAQLLGLELVSPDDALIAQLEHEWTRRRIDIIALGQVATIGFPTFVKPVVPKLFAAGVYPTLEDLLTETHDLAPETEMLIAEVVTFTCEVRCLVRDQKVLSAACYEGAGDVSEAVRFTEALLTKHATPPSIVVDVGYVTGRGWAVIELNACWGAGLNGCDPGAMVECLLVATRVADAAEQTKATDSEQ